MKKTFTILLTKQKNIYQFFFYRNFLIPFLAFFCFTIANVQAQFAKGADISWITEMEASGYVWYGDDGTQQELITILKDHDMNAIRLRVWVDPPGGWCNIDDMVDKAIVANNEGMDILITIHMSDHWADPGKQTKPAAWASMTNTQLATAVYNHVYDVVSALGNNDITPKWVQIGNETNDGMLWENGRASGSGMSNYAQFISSGHNAVKSYNANIKTVVHLSNGFNNALYQWNIGGIIDNGAQFDVIGLSLYPELDDWQTLNDQCYDNMLDLKSRYNKDVMVVEVGMREDSPDVSKQFIEDLIDKTQQANGLGLFYWEPQTYNDWKGYRKGAWQSDGRPSIALDAFLDSALKVDNVNDYYVKMYPNPVSDKLMIDANYFNLGTIAIYDVLGKKIREVDNISHLEFIDVSDLPSGLYFLTTNTKAQFKFLKK